MSTQHHRGGPSHHPWHSELWYAACAGHVYTWDLGMCPSSYLEVNDFPGSQNSPSMEEGFEDPIWKTLFSILISHFFVPFFQLLPSCSSFVSFCWAISISSIYSSLGGASVLSFPFGGFCSAFPFSRLCAGVGGEVSLSVGVPVAHGYRVMQKWTLLF